MTRKSLRLNTIFTLLQRIMGAIYGFVITRFVLKSYGSEVNGLISSVNQLLSIIVFLELGVGTVIQYEFYKPLVEKDSNKLKTIFTIATKFFSKIGNILIAYVLFVAVLFPIFVKSPLSYFSTVMLIFSISIGILSQYYLGMVTQLFLNADLKSYVHLSVQVITTIINIIVSIYLMQRKVNIEYVKLIGSIIYLARPLFNAWYIKRNYHFMNGEINQDYKLPQMWAGASQHIAYTVTNSTDIIILTLFSTLQNVSIYSVYNLIFQGLKQVYTSLLANFRALFGKLLAQDKIIHVKFYFENMEFIVHTISTILFAMLVILILPFIKIYTSGVKDINYIVPIFSLIMTLSLLLDALRNIYNTIIFSAGHFEQTKNSSILEAVLNIIFSLILVRNYGLIGVAIGTFISLLYRLIYLIIYLTKNIFYLDIRITVKQFLVDLVIVILVIIGSKLFNINDVSYIGWIISSIIIAIEAVLVSLIINFVFNRDSIKRMVRYLRKK